MKPLVDFMTEEFGCGREEAILTFTAVVGAMTVARASTDKNVSREIVKSVRTTLLSLWDECCTAEQALA